MSHNQESYYQLLNKSIKSQQELINIQKQNIQLKEQVNKLESSISRFRTNNTRMSKQNASLKASNARLTNKVNKLKDLPAVEEWKQKNERLREQVKYWKGNKAIQEGKLAQYEAWLTKNGLAWYANNDKTPTQVKGEVCPLIKVEGDQNLLKKLTDEKIKVLHQVEKITKLRKIIVKLVKQIEENELMNKDALEAIINV